MPDQPSEQQVEEALEIADGSVSHWFDGPFIGDGIDWTTRPHAENCAGCVIETLAAALRERTAERDEALADKAEVHKDLAVALEHLETLTAERHRLREALVEAAQFASEAEDYGCAWPIGLDTDPQEQRGMARDTFIVNAQCIRDIARAALNPTEQEGGAGS